MNGRDLMIGGRKIAGPYWPIVPGLLAVGAGIAAGVSTPSIPPGKALPDWFATFFSTSAVVIATLFVALALGARQISVSAGAASLTVLYVGVGEVAAVAALSGGLPHSVYPWLLGITVGAGLGALSSSVIVGAGAIGSEAMAQQQATLSEILGRLPPGE